MRNKFYCYILIDPRNNIPFYVGKGCGNRARKHISDAKRGKGNLEKNRIIKDIISEKLEPKVDYFAKHIDEKTALELESRKIAEIGIDNLTNKLKKGCLSSKGNGDSIAMAELCREWLRMPEPHLNLRAEHITLKEVHLMVSDIFDSMVNRCERAKLVYAISRALESFNGKKFSRLT